MDNKYRRSFRKSRSNNIGIETLIERLRKVRALNCSPSDVGMNDNLEWLDKYGRAYFLLGKMGQ